MKIYPQFINYNTYQPNKTLKKSQDFRSLSVNNPLSFRSNVIIVKKLGQTNRNFISDLINNYKENNPLIELIGKGTFGIVYKITLPIMGVVAVKIIKPEKENSAYGGGNLKREADILEKMPHKCKNSQKFIDYFVAKDKEYLVTSFISGKSLSQHETIAQAQMNNIVSELLSYDSSGLMFYDLNANNIKLDNDKICFFDFEFAATKDNSIPNLSALNDLHHIGRNLYYPQKSNVNAFENRALGEFINKVEETQGEVPAKHLVKRYLHSLSSYHKEMGRYYGTQPNVPQKAIDYENILARLYENPSEEIVSIEKDLIYLRSITLNYYLYLKRVSNNALLENDYKYYTDFEKYLNVIGEKVREVQTKLKNLSRNNDKDIQEYCSVNSLYINSLSKINCSESMLKIPKDAEVNKLKQLKEEIIEKNEPQRMGEFLELYHSFTEKYSQNSDILTFCNNIKDVLEKTLEFINKSN